MGKTYRRDSDRKFKNFSKGKSKPKKLKHGQDEPKFQKHHLVLEIIFAKGK